MMRRRAFVLLGLTFSLGFATKPAVGDEVDEGKEISPPLLGHRNWILPRGSTAEVDFELALGAVVHGFFRADAEVVVETHRHVGDEILVFGSGTGAAATMRFEAPEEGLYSFAFTHPGGAADEIAVDVAVRGGDGVEVVRWIVGPTDPPKDDPP